MRRLASLAAILLLLSGLVPAVASANTGLQVNLALMGLDYQGVSMVDIGEHVVLSVSLSTGSGGSVTDLFGSSVDIYYDPALVEPVLPEAGITSATSATGVITAAIDPELVFVAVTATGTTATPARISLIALRLGDATPGASATGSLGMVEFVARKSGSFTFSAQPSSSSTNYVGGETVVTLLDSQGTPLSFQGSSVSLTVSGGPPVISHPLDLSYIGVASVTVSGTGPAGTTMDFTLHAGATLVNSGQLTSDGSGGFSLPFTGLGDGTYTVTVTNGSGSAAHTFIIDTTAPSVTISPPAVLTDPYLVEGTYADANIEAVYLTVDVPGTPLDSDRATLGTSGAWSKSVSLGSSGVLYATAVDRAGNVKVASQSYTFTAPAIELKFAGADGSVPKLMTGDKVALEAHVYNTPGHMRGLLMEMQVATSHFTLDSAETLTTAGSFWDGSVTPDVTYDQASGRLTVMLTSAVAPASGNTLAFTVNLVVGSLTSPAPSVTALTFAPVDTAGGARLDTGSAGETIPAAAPISTAVADLIVGAALSGQVQLLGRTNASGVVVSVFDSAGNVLSQGITDPSGQFSLRVPQGSGYTLVIQRHSYLSRVYTDFAMGTTDVSGLSEQLRPGDIIALSPTSPPRVFLEDLAALAHHWGSPGTDADLDGGGSVDLADLSLLGQYWAQRGEVFVYGQ